MGLGLEPKTGRLKPMVEEVASERPNIGSCRTKQYIIRDDLEESCVLCEKDWKI